MKAALVAMFSSKKFLTALVGTIVALGLHFGLALDPVLVAAVVGLFAVAIGAQGLADQGKESAKLLAPKERP